MYYKLVKNIEELRKHPIKGGDFKHKLMVKWVSEKMGIVGENKGAATYSTFEEDRSGYNANNEDCMIDTGVYQEMLVEYEEMIKEQQEKKMNRQLETYEATEVGGKVTNV